MEHTLWPAIGGYGGAERATTSCGVHRNVVGNTHAQPDFRLDAMGSYCRAVLPVKTAQQLAVITGRSASCCEKWLARDNAPDAISLARMINHFGPGFVAQCFNAPWAEQAARHERKRELERELERMGG